MSDTQHSDSYKQADTKADAIAVIIVIAILVCAAVFWVSGQ